MLYPYVPCQGSLYWFTHSHTCAHVCGNPHLLGPLMQYVGESHVYRHVLYVHVHMYLNTEYNGVTDEGDENEDREDWMSGELPQSLLPPELRYVAKHGLLRECKVQAVPLKKHVYTHVHVHRGMAQ